MDGTAFGECRSYSLEAGLVTSVVETGSPSSYHCVPPNCTPSAADERHMIVATAKSSLRLEDSASHIVVHLPVPPAVPALSLLCVSDTHDFHEDMLHGPLPKADILVHAGDFTCIGSREEVESFGRWIDSLLSQDIVGDVVFVSGNHDLSMPLTAKRPVVRAAQEQMKRAITERPHVHYLEDSGCEVQGLRFWGTPWTTRFGNWAFQLPDSDDPEFGLAGKFAAIPADGSVDILVSHQPPLGQGDAHEAAHGKGSRTLLERVLQANPLLHIFGHIHSGHGVSTHERCRTAFVNAAICDEDVRPTQKPVLVVLEPQVGTSQRVSG